MQDIVFYVAANETLGMVRDYSNMNNASAPVLTLGVAVCLRIRLFADIKVPTPYPVTSLSGITDWHWSMDADFDRSTACKLVADEGGISVHTVTDTINGSTMSFTEFVIPISNMNTEELAAWLGNDGTKSGLTGELVGYDSEGHAVFVLQIEGFKVRNRVAGLSDPTAVDEGFVTRIIADSMIQTAVSASAATKQDKLTAATGITITGGTQVSINLAAGERMAVISGNTVAQLRYFPITNITGNTVTLAAGSAYRMNATTGTKTLYAENMDDDTFGLEGHIEIFVANAGSIQTGKLAGGTTEVILADALEPDAVNNCTVRFHDHKAIISVEDHVAGHIVTVSAGTVANSLYYWLMQPNTASDAATQYIGFDARTNNTPVSFEGAANTAVKHVVGNGYAQTLLTGNVAPAAALTVSDLGLQNVTVTGGTLTLGDAYIPSGSTVAVSGGGLAVEKVTGAGSASVIDLGGTHLAFNSSIANISGCTIYGGSAQYGGAMNLTSSSYVSMTSCTIGDNEASGVGHTAVVDRFSTLSMSGCIVSGISAANSRFGIIAQSGSVISATGCTLETPGFGLLVQTGGLVLSGCNISTRIANRNSSTVTFAGSNTLTARIAPDYGSGGAVIISSGAILDLTGNSNTTPIAPGGGITFAPGGATVLVGSGTASSSYMMDNVTLPGMVTSQVVESGVTSTVVIASGAKLTNTAVVNLGGANVYVGGAPMHASGVTFTGGSGTSGGAFYIGKANVTLTSCAIVNNSASMRGGISMQSATFIASSCVISGNSGLYGGGIGILDNSDATLTDCVISGNSGANGTDVYIGTVKSAVITGCTVGQIGLTNGGKVTFAGNNKFDSCSAVVGSASVTISNGAVLDFTGNTNAKPINPGGAITIPAGAVVKIIGSDGPTSSAYLSELALTGTTITNVPSVLGATVTVPATGGPWEVHFVDSTSSTYSATGTERQEVLAGAVTYIGGQ